MSWNDYHLNSPSFCTPLPVMRGLVSALCERREAIDSNFHAACVSSGNSAVMKKRLTDVLFCETDGEIPFREIRKESRSFIPYGGSSHYYSFMHMFDAFLLETIRGFSQVAGYSCRLFGNSSGDTAYNSLESLASALSEPLIAPSSIPASSTVATDGHFQILLNAAWAAQRTKMLKLLRYVRLNNGGFMMQYETAAEHGYGSSPQNAYRAISSWTASNTVFAGWETRLERRVEYHRLSSEWAIDNAHLAANISPAFDGCLETPVGSLLFSAADLRSRNEEGIPIDEESTVFPFDAMGTPVSSGLNALILSSGTFASWSRNQVDVGSSGDEDKYTVTGWQALNVRVIYDYESVFNFKQEE